MFQREKISCNVFVLPNSGGGRNFKTGIHSNYLFEVPISEKLKNLGTYSEESILSHVVLFVRLVLYFNLSN